MIARMWRGWTAPGDADTYEDLLRTEILPGIKQCGIAGLTAIDLLRFEADDQVEFVTLLWFDCPEAVQEFAGPDPQQAFVPAAARALLARFDERAVHYQSRYCYRIRGFRSTLAPAAFLPGTW